MAVGMQLCSFSSRWALAGKLEGLIFVDDLPARVLTRQD